MTEMAWFGKQVFVATFEPTGSGIVTLTPTPTTRIEAQKLVKAHQRRAIDAREKPDPPSPPAPAGRLEPPNETETAFHAGPDTCP
jgi:hypothetical protein